MNFLRVDFLTNFKKGFIFFFKGIIVKGSIISKQLSNMYYSCLDLIIVPYCFSTANNMLILCKNGKMQVYMLLQLLSDRSTVDPQISGRFRAQVQSSG